MFVDPPIRFRTKGAEDGSGGLVDSGLETVGGEYIVDDRKGEKIAMDMAAKLNRKIDKKLHEMKIQHVSPYPFFPSLFFHNFQRF